MYMNKTIEELHELLKNGEVTVEELVNESINKSREVNELCNAFVTIVDNPKKYEVTDNLLSGIPYGIKDNYSTKGILSTGSSNTLKDYVPFFSATALRATASPRTVPKSAEASIVRSASLDGRSARLLISSIVRFSGTSVTSQEESCIASISIFLIQISSRGEIRDLEIA